MIVLDIMCSFVVGFIVSVIFKKLVNIGLHHMVHCIESILMILSIKYLATDKKWFDFYELQELMLTNSDEVVFKNTPAYINIFGELSKIISGSNTDKVYRQKEFIILNTSDGCFLPGLIQHSDKKNKIYYHFYTWKWGQFF